MSKIIHRDLETAPHANTTRIRTVIIEIVGALFTSQVMQKASLLYATGPL